MATVLVLGGAAGTGAVAASAASPVVTMPGSQLNADIQSGEAGEHGTANDQETAAEKNVDDGAVENVDVQENQTGQQESGIANDKADASGDKNESSGASGAGGASGQQDTGSTGSIPD